MIPEGARILEWKLLTGTDFETLRGRRVVVLVTCSPMEVHGPHLPVIADNLEAEQLSLRAVEKLLPAFPDITFLRLPPIYTAADVLPMRGSLRFRPSTIVQVLSELGESLYRQGFPDVWIGNFHGGPRHFVAIEAACAKVNRRFGARMVPVFSLLLTRLTGGSSDLSEVLSGVLGVPKEAVRGDSHGGAVETSILLSLIGERVAPNYGELPPCTPDLDLEAAGKAPLQKGEKPTLWELVRGFPIKQRYFEQRSYAGAPALASPEAGDKILDYLAGRTAQALEELLRGEIGPKDCHSPLWPIRHILLSETIGWLFDKAFAQRVRPV